MIYKISISGLHNKLMYMHCAQKQFTIPLQIISVDRRINAVCTYIQLSYLVISKACIQGMIHCVSA